MATYWENSSWRDIYSKKVLLKLFIGHWQWFLLSMMICLCTAYLYTRLTTPIYKITAKLLVKDADVYEYQRYSKNFSSNMQTFGTMSMSEGVANEAEMIWSTQLMGEVVKHLKLYVNYKEEGRIKDRQVYATQPINVDLDSVHQDIMDRLAYEDFRTITMKMVKPSATSDSIIVKGVLRSGRDKVWGFSRQLKSLPATIKTPFGKLTFKVPADVEMKEGGAAIRSAKNADNTVGVMFFGDNDWSAEIETSTLYDSEVEGEADDLGYPKDGDLTDEKTAKYMQDMGFDWDGSQLSTYKTLLSMTEADESDDNSEAFNYLATLKACTFGMSFPRVRYLEASGVPVYFETYAGIKFDPAKEAENDEYRSLWVSAFVEPDLEYTAMIRANSQEEALQIASTIKVNKV